MTIPHVADAVVLPVVAAGALIALTFTPSDIATVIIATGTFIGAILGGTALILTAIRTTRISKSVDQAVTKVDDAVVQIVANTELTKVVDAKMDTVGVKVDGQASRAEAEMALLREELKWVRERLSEQRQDAAVLAQSKSAKAVAIPIPATGAEEHLEQISDNTAEIKRNTAKKDRR